MSVKGASGCNTNMVIWKIRHWNFLSCLLIYQTLLTILQWNYFKIRTLDFICTYFGFFFPGPCCYPGCWQNPINSFPTLYDRQTYIPDSKVHGANMGPIWGRQDPGGPHELCYLGLLYWGLINWICPWWSILIRYRSDTNEWDQYVINVDSRVLPIYVCLQIFYSSSIATVPTYTFSLFLKLSIVCNTFLDDTTMLQMVGKLSSDIIVLHEFKGSKWCHCRF